MTQEINRFEPIVNLVPTRDGLGRQRKTSLALALRSSSNPGGV